MASLNDSQRETVPARPPATRSLDWLAAKVAGSLGIRLEEVDPDRPFLSLGLDSLSAMELKVEIDAGLGTTLPLSMLMEGSGIRELAERASEHLAGSPAQPSETSAPAGARIGAGQPLSHGQQMLWYAHQFTTDRRRLPHHRGRDRSARSWTSTPSGGRSRRVIARQDALRTTFCTRR